MVGSILSSFFMMSSIFLLQGYIKRMSSMFLRWVDILERTPQTGISRIFAYNFIFIKREETLISDQFE